MIEDEPGTQLLTKKRLRDLGHQVVTAPNGAMGLMEARAQPFDLFLVDIILGSGIDGYEVCRRLRSIPQTRSVPVVLVSSNVSGCEQLHRGYEAGCEAYLVKGDVVLLEDVVRAMLRFKSLQDDVNAQNRLLEEQNRRLHEEQARGAELEDVLRSKESSDSAFRDHAIGRPDGVLIVDADGVVRYADRGARSLFSKELEGQTLGSIAPATGLEAVVRDANTNPREGHQLDVKLRQGSRQRTLNAVVIPMPPGSEDSLPLRVVLLRDQGQRRLGAEMLRFEETAVPRRELGPLLDAARLVYRPTALVGEHPRMVELRRLVTRELETSRPVTIRGEPGCERAFVARVLHYAGSRGGAFLPIDCRSVSTSNLEVELFGHVKGAAPSAGGSRPGLFQCAHLGTVMLDRPEVLPFEIQNKIVRAVTSGEVWRVGANESETVDVRLVVATDSNADRSLFSDELLDLLQTEFVIPALRERIGDLPLLVERMLEEQPHAQGPLSITAGALDALSRYEWPEGVRELRGVVEHAIALAADGVIGGAQLPSPQLEIFRAMESSADGVEIPSVPPRGVPSIATLGTSVIAPELVETVEAMEQEPVSLELYERLALERALRETNGDRLKAADLLGVGKSTLYRKLKRYDIH